MTADAWGHVGYVLLLAGQWLVSGGRASGWLLRVLGGFVWLGVGVAIGMPSIWLWTGLFIAIDVRGWLRARR